MFSILALVGSLLKETFTSWSFLLVYILLFVITNWQYQRLEDMSARSRRYHPLHIRATLVSMGLGLVGGIIGSLILILVGVDISQVNILPLWVAALMLMMISPRFLCFAYAGGVLALISLTTGYPRMDIPQLMALVAVLHMVESLLILWNGHLNPVPVYLRREGQVVGGFNLQKFWPIPLLALASTAMAAPGALPPMPDWWPLLKSYSAAVPGQNYILISVLAVLGYGEITTTAAPAKRVRRSSAYLLLFSLILLALSVASSYHPSVVWLAAIFSPVGHELVIWLGTRQEKNQPPLYVPDAPGVMLLDVVPGSPAWSAGLRTGDKILMVNGQPTDYRQDLGWIIKQGTGHFAIKAARQGQAFDTVLQTPPARDWGITPVPDAEVRRYLTIKEDTLFDVVRSLWRRITGQ